MDIKIGQHELPGRIIIALYGQAAPKTVRNFAEICSGVNGGNLTYRHNIFHRIV